MMAVWVDNEDQERESFNLWCGGDNNGKQNDDHCNDHRSQRDYSGSSRKRKLDDVVAAIELNPRGNKSGITQEKFEKLLHKQCP